MVGEDFVIEDIPLDGYQIVRGQYFSRVSDAWLTLWETTCQFNVSAYEMLNNCEAVQIMVNLKSRSIVVKPVSSSEDNAIVWLRNPDNPRTSKLECSPFTRRLYSAWGWNPALRYRTHGRLVKSRNNLMLLFDFHNPEVWDGMRKVKEDG